MVQGDWRREQSLRVEMADYDVAGFGAVAVDDIVELDHYPEEDSKIEAISMRREPGGLAGTALVAASRMGGHCAYGGTIGTDELSDFVLQRFAIERIDTQHVRQEPEARPFHSIIAASLTNGTRTVIFSSEGVVGAHPLISARELVSKASTLLIDVTGVDGMIRISEIAKELSIPRIGDFEREVSGGFWTLVNMVDHLIIPFAFASSITGRGDPARAIDELWGVGRNTIVITNGEHGSWYRSVETGNRVVHQEAFPVTVVDTTGCGDVFHGVYAYALAQKQEISTRMRLASAAAALKATRRGGQAGAPYRGEVERFMISQIG